MRKKLLSILLSVCMVLTLLPTAALASPVSYGIWVGATEVTSDNANNVTGDGIVGSVTYDPDTNILTLDNATITRTNSYNYAISRLLNNPEDPHDPNINLNINLVGNNAITISSSEIPWAGVAGIYATKVSIKGTEGASLSVCTPDSSPEYNICINGAKEVAIENCTVTATTGNSSGSSNNQCSGISVGNGSVSIKNATVTAHGGAATVNSQGILVYAGSLSIENSTVNAIGGIYGIRALFAPSITISASTVTATGNSTALLFTHFSGGIVAPTASGHTATASADISGAGAASVNVTDANFYGASPTYKYVQIAPASLSQPVISTLAISGSLTAGHNYTVSDLDSYKPTITPNGATITAQGWQQYNPNGGGFWEPLSSSGITPDTGSAFTLRYYANYSGGTVYSNEVMLNVVGNTTSLALEASPASPQDTGISITLTATLTSFFAGPGVSGQTIIFKNGSTDLGTANLNTGGVAVFTWTPDSTGTYSLTAEYAGSAYNTSATSNALNYTMNVAFPTAAEYAAGASGTDYVVDDTATPHTLTIKTAKGAAYWCANGASYLDYTILLANDVDVSGFSWSPVGNESGTSFTGTFDGQGCSITGLTASADSYAGLFSHAVNATIKNLCLSGSVTINNSVDGSYGGALVAYAVNCTIANCCSHTDVTASSSGTASVACAGGLVGIADSATAITNCFNTGNIHAAASGATGSRAYAGGIAGENYRSKVINCYSIGSVTAATASEIYAGGVVGRNGNNGTATVKNCYYLNGTANKGVGNVWGSVPTITGCGTIGSDKTTLTAGTADQFASAQTLEYYADTLLNALNGWVNDKASADYNIWQADSAGSPVNGGYPVLNAAWGSINLTGVGCNVAVGKLTGTTDNMQYSLDGGSTWQDCAAGDTTELTFVAGTVKVRQKDNQTNVRTVITIAAPATSNAPTLGSKTYNSVTLTAMTGYEYSKDDGATWQNSNLFASLSSSTTYSFVARIKATATALPGTISAVLNVTTNESPSGDGGSNGGGTKTPVGTPVIVDGKTQNIGTKKISGDTTTVTVDQSRLGTSISDAASGSSVVVPVSENDSATASLVVKNIEDMAAKGMTLTVQTGSVAYNLNTAAIDTAALKTAFPGADMSKVPFDVTISNSTLTVDGETLVLSPVAFTVAATYGGKTVDVDTFSAYIDRVIEVTAEQAAKITTAVVVNVDGSVRHVPTNVIEKDGRYYAVVNSRTNSTYALIQNEVTFADAAGKWYEAAVNEMGSRKIIAGRSASVFDGDASITRAEFAVILVRALGLPADGVSTFSDVPADAWYGEAVATAVKFGLMECKGDNQFDPNANITRQEAMLMLQRVAALTEFTGAVGNLDSFTDADSIGSWALDAAKWSVGSGLIQGAYGKLNPTAKITRAESATIILRLLQKVGLVDVRSKA